MTRRADHPRKRCSGNLRAAPFAITPSLVARMLEIAPRPAQPAPSEENPTRPSTWKRPRSLAYSDTRLSPIRRAEIDAEVQMRTGVGAAMACEIARQLVENGRGEASFETPPAAAPQDERSADPAPAITPPPAPTDFTVDPIVRDGRIVDFNVIRSEPRLGSRAPEPLNGTGTQPIAPVHVDEAQHCHSLVSADEHTGVAGAPSVPVAAAIAAEVAQTAARRRVARRCGGGAGDPLPVRFNADQADITVDAHERELRRIDRRPAIKTGEHAERRAAQRAAEQARAQRLELIRAAAEKLRNRATEAGV